MTKLHVFHDPTGRRRRLIMWGASALSVVVLFSTAVFILAAILRPLLPDPASFAEPVANLSRAPVAEHNRQLSTLLLRRAKGQLDREIEETQRISRTLWSSKNSPESRVVAAFYTPGSETSYFSLRSNADHITHIFPEWIRLEKESLQINYDNWNGRYSEGNENIVELAREHGIKIFPTFSNQSVEGFDSSIAHALLHSKTQRERVAKELRTWLLASEFNGLNVDFRRLDPTDALKLPAFLAALKREFADSGLQLTFTYEAGDARLPLWRIASHCSFVTLLVREERKPSAAPGPLASIPWYTEALQNALRNVPAQKLIVALDNYALDWRDDGKPAEERSYLSALLQAKEFHASRSPSEMIQFDPLSLNPWFTYVDEWGTGHTVWFVDAVTSYNQWLLADRAGVRGIGIWDVGSEDPAIWSAVGSSSKGADIAALSQIQFPYQIKREGEGDIISARAEVEDGERKLEVDASNGLVTQLRYERLPARVVVEKNGYESNVVALTFDDGPADPYSEQILDYLKQENVQATFFLIGQNAQQYPDIVRRMINEGHLIGNHTFTHPDMAHVSEERRVLELNTTQRVLQSITGRSALLFRPPYIGEDDPSTVEGVKAIQTAERLHYLSVGISADAQDWSLWKIVDPEKGRERRTGQDLAQMMLDRIDGMKGNALLLHDGGGDRSATVEAVKILVPELKRRGYKFKTIGELAGLTPLQVMPTVSSNDLVLGGVSRVFFEIVFGVQFLLQLVLVILVALGIARLTLVVVLAIASRLKEKYDEEEIGEDLQDPVTVIIPAHNERAVIRRTIDSILVGTHKNLEILVVDDGSTDGTGDEVALAYEGHPKVTLLRQTNAGKAEALNNGMRVSKHDILVCLDADTQFAPDAIAKMVRHFKDPKVGAVAGNVKVGNRRSILTHWQSIEYIFNLSLNRRAYAMLNAIICVAGAAGAWRKSAVLGCGGYHVDTLAEDMDLTWRIRRAGWVVLNESRSIGYTEAPENLEGLFKQRFRWAYGALQCLWKHRSVMFRHGWFGWIGVPSVLIFQVGFEMLAPLADLQMLTSLVTVLFQYFSSDSSNPEMQTLAGTLYVFLKMVVLYISFFTIELVSTMIAFRLDREPMKPLWLLFFQRFVYRQIMYVVLWRALWKALSGWRQGWGVLQRSGTVSMPGQVAPTSEQVIPKQ